ncbi:MAG: Trm112 family protein [Candidatus Woesearchaeota archaeon]|jgi:hypothetical protein|nr:Trm112 family protein [Candidatus Woesearchaeota archaeon]MDP7476602.1 Trm112 family protein [Candidatus Woesearchaeota archaeon]
MQKKDPIPKDLFNILACPICRANLRYSGDRKSLVCVKCGKKYPIKQGIPILLPQQAKKR